MNEEYMQFVQDRMIKQRVAALTKSEPKAESVEKMGPIQKLFAEARGKAEVKAKVDPATVKDPVAKMFAEARKG